MKQKVEIFQDGVYLRTAKVKKAKIDLGKALINKLTKQGNIIRNNMLLSLQK